MNAAGSTQDKAARSAERKAKLHRYWESVRYAKYVMFHPFDGFWDLVHEKRGTVAAANTFVFLFLVVRVMRLMFTNFQFNNASLQFINIFEQIASLFFPMIILCIANWGMTTLFDGKGTFKDIYMALGYAFPIYIILNVIYILLSNVLTFEEAQFLSVLSYVAIVWMAGLILVGQIQIHDYSLGKTLIFLVVTVVGTMVILFLLLAFFSLLTDAFAWFVSLYREIVFRLC